MANLIMQRYEERKNSGCDPTGYGMPGTLSGWQSVYSSLGYHVTGSAGAGGYYYMDPGVAGVTKIYKTHSEFLQKCYNVGGAHAYGTKKKQNPIPQILSPSRGTTISRSSPRASCKPPETALSIRCSPFWPALSWAISRPTASNAAVSR